MTQEQIEMEEEIYKIRKKLQKDVGTGKKNWIAGDKKAIRMMRKHKPAIIEGNYSDLVQNVIAQEMQKLPKNSLVVDAGSGPLYKRGKKVGTAFQLSRMRPDLDIHAVDLEQSERKKHKKISYKQGDIRDLLHQGTEGKFANLISGRGITRYLLFGSKKDFDRYVSSAHKTLKQGGKFILPDMPRYLIVNGQKISSKEYLGLKGFKVDREIRIKSKRGIESVFIAEKPKQEKSMRKKSKIVIKSIKIPKDEMQ